MENRVNVQGNSKQMVYFRVVMCKRKTDTGPIKPGHTQSREENAVSEGFLNVFQSMDTYWFIFFSLRCGEIAWSGVRQIQGRVGDNRTSASTTSTVRGVGLQLVEQPQNHQDTLPFFRQTLFLTRGIFPFRFPLEMAAMTKGEKFGPRPYW